MVYTSLHMEILFVVLAFSVGLLALGGLIGVIIWLYRRLIPTKQLNGSEATPSQNLLFATPALKYPEHFGWAVGLVLLGFNVGMYHFFTTLGPLFRVPAAGWLVWSVTVALAWFILLGRKNSLFVLSTLAVSLLSSLFLFVRANGFVQTWNIIFFLFTQLLLFIYMLRSRLPISVGGWLGALLTTLPVTLIQMLAVLKSVVSRDKSSTGTFLSWVKTATLAFVILAIFLGLLSQADPVFAEVVREFRSQLLGRTLWSLLIVFLVTGWWTVTKTAQEDTETEARWITYRDVVAVLSSVIIVIALFLVVQFQYLFGASRELLITLDLTFSEYVRKGFTELLLAVFIGGIISYLAAARSHLWTGAQRQMTRVATTVLLSELGLLLLSAWRRDVLYVDTYGMTRVRIVGEVFLAWLAFFLIVLLLFGWRRIQERMAIIALWSAALVVIVTMNVVNIDRLVVQGAPGHHTYTDYFYLFQLSEDAAPAWPELLKEIESEVAVLVAKPDLTEAERAQLAGLKLATISFIETRDSLFQKYAATEWLLVHDQQLGLDLRKTAQQNYNFAYAEDVLTVVDKQMKLQQSNLSSEGKELPEYLEKYRGWQFTNAAERGAYQLLASQEEASFTLPTRILTQIIEFQVRTQTALDVEENRLLHELQYQFISVGLSRYWNRQMYPPDLSNLTNLNQVAQKEWSLLESSSPAQIETAAQLTCASPELQNQVSQELYGIAIGRSTKPVDDPYFRDKKLFTLKSFVNPDSSTVVTLVTPSVLEYRGPTATEESEVLFREGDIVSYPDKYGSMNAGLEGQPTFIKTVATPVAHEFNGTCTVYFETSDIQAFYTY